MMKHPHLASRRCRPLPSRRWLAWLLFASPWFLPPVPAAPAAEAKPAPARELHRLVPANASVVLTVEDLRGQVGALLRSPLARDLWELPAVKTWMGSEKYEQLETLRDQIEGFLQAKLTEIRDQILGDAVVVALVVPENVPLEPRSARGILVLKASNPGLLKRLVELLNTTQQQTGEVAAVVEKKRGGVSYFLREFPAGSDHLPECFVSFADGTFACSNDTSLLGELIDRKTGKAASGSQAAASLADAPRFAALEKKLPTHALARLFIDSRLAERVFQNASEPRSPVEALIRRYAAALESAGAALVADEAGLALNVAEVFEPGKFQELFGKTATSRVSAAPRMERVPGTTLAVGSLEIDLSSLTTFLRQMVPASEQNRLANIEVTLKGIFLGQDPSTRILPALGPRIVAFAEAPASWDATAHSDDPTGVKWPFPSAVAIQLQDTLDRPAGSQDQTTPSPADAVDNALNTGLAALALTPKLASAAAHIEGREVAGTMVKTLTPAIPLAYAVDRAGKRLVVGNSSSVVERYLAGGSDSSAGARFHLLQERAFPEARSYACLDLGAVAAMIARHQDRMTSYLADQQHRSRDDVARDLEQVRALCHVFDAVYLTHRVDAAGAAGYQSFGLLVHPNSGTKPDSPGR